MKITSIEEAKRQAKEQSLDSGNKDVAIYIIYCNRTKCFYTDTDGLLRLWEQPFGHYINGDYIPDKSLL